MNKGLLPIGSVVRLTDGTRKVMITGYYSKTKDDDKIYDYNGCVFPEGLMENLYLLFESKQIEEVFYKGLENEELIEYTKKISSNEMGVTYNVLDDAKPVNGGVKRGRVPKAATSPMSKGEMMAKYGVKKVSGDGTTSIDS